MGLRSHAHYFHFSWNKALEFLIEVEDPKKKATKKDGAKLTKKEKKKIKACFTVSDTYNHSF